MSWLKKSPKTRGKQDGAAASPTQVKTVPRKPTPRGWTGRGAGETMVISPAPEWRGTTVQVCGLWPYGVGTGAPMIGVPLGRHLFNRGTVCCDPISWFQRANLISNPSVFVLSKPGLGKSTIIRRMATGLAGYGVQPLVLGDLKPDYVDLIKEMNGQVITLGRGRGYLNILDPGEAGEAAELLSHAADLERKALKEEEAELSYLRSSDVPDDANQAQAIRERTAQLVGSLSIHAENISRDERLAVQVLQDAHGRRLTMVSALLTIMRREPPTDREETIIDRALKLLDEKHEGIPVLKDLLELIQSAPTELRAVALDRGDMARYQVITEDLEASLIGLVSGGRLGELFSQQTTTRMRRDRPVVYDVSSIDDSEMDLQAAVLLACWSAGFGTVNVATALADAELEPRRHYFVILDELWRALRAGRGMVDRVDALTRLNRQRGVGMAMISHTMSDLMSLSSEEDRMKAKGFVERSGMVICGGLPASEMPLLNSAISMSRAEQEMLQGWQDPPAWDPVSGKEADPPGRGKFLIKVGGRPGIPLTVELTEAEKHINDTNKLWHAASRTGVVDREAAV
ncbi:ATP/GTP-binding protein [Cryobacterium sp. MDB2-33-2]|uniref:ATP/GTP-binding protein n=1 Tax=Cryobacterium sp. MDB2-33-2 TaxID=1259179 RepID=UPI00106AF18F|nr:ATP/GTP-binding protein [Cryobacterium sp. MDB2-33-2]TFC02730.1 ATP/GTP-binding protein [Cryobacterium sp. MDB2-33-2]